MITEKLGFKSTFQFSDASYQDGLRLGLVDYQVFGGTAGFLYHLTERDDVQIAGTYANFHTKDAPFALRAYYPGVLLSFTHAFSEGLSFTAYGGPRFLNSAAQFSGLNQKEKDTIWVFGTTITQEFDRATLQLSVTRDILPSGFGMLIQTDRLGATASYDLTENVTVSLDAAGYIVDGATIQARGGRLLEQQLFYLTPKVAWHFSEWWRAEASYGFRWRDTDSINEPVTSNMLTFMLTYYPPKFAISN